jgi:hypothetical protein
MAHDAVVALRAVKAAFLAVVRAAMHVVLDAIGKGEPAPHCCQVDEAIEVDPLAAIRGPGLPAIRFTNAASLDCLLEGSEVLASHF